MTINLSEYKWSNSDASHCYSYLLKPINSLIPPPPRSVLDLGCGNGWLCNWLYNKGYEVVGVDPSFSGIEIAQKKYPKIEFYALPATPDLYRVLNKRLFDLVISIEVVEHCYAPRDWAKSAYNCLNPGGTLICSTPYHGYIKNLCLALSGKLDDHFTALWDGGHIKFWSYNTLSQLLLEVGFVDLKFMGAGRIPYLWKSMLFSAKKHNAR